MHGTKISHPKIASNVETGTCIKISLPSLSKNLCVFKLNRHQNHLKLLFTNPESKKTVLVYEEKDGTIKMNSIKPKLGKGLGDLNDINRGKIFPSLKINFNKEFDDLFSCYPILITNKKVKEKLLKIKTFSSIDIPEIEIILKKFNSNSLIIRPDRFVLASTDKSDLRNFSRFYLNQFFAS